jgi:hypothetical protein
MTRLAAGLMLAGSPVLLGGSRANDVRVTEIEPSCEEFTYLAPCMFGGREVDRVTLLNVRCTGRNAAGKVAHGFGSMRMENLWAWTSKTLSYVQTLGSMKEMAGRIAMVTLAYR